MRTLTDQELAEARTHLELIQAIKQDAWERHEQAKAPEFEERTPVQQLAYVLITKAIFNMLDAQVDELGEKLGVDPHAPTDQKLAEVIELFDGNRRAGRLP